MKITLAASLALAASSVSAFVPQSRTAGAFVVKSSIPETCKTSGSCLLSKSLDDEVEDMVQKELRKTKRMSNLRNEKGVEYAPWMNISKEDEDEIRALMRSKAEARRRRQEEETTVRGSLLKDSAFQELSGTGLRSKIVDGNCVELEWATGSEANTKGFIIKRRPTKTDDFTVVASYENYGPLASKGKDGGVYRFMDENVAPGGWVYRVTECETSGSESDLSQCLVEIQTEEEQKGALLALAAFGLVAVGAVVAGTVLDPVQY